MQYGKILLASNRLSDHSFDSFYSAVYSYYFLLCSTEDKSQKSNQVSFAAHSKWAIHAVNFTVKTFDFRNVELHRIESCLHRQVFK